MTGASRAERVLRALSSAPFGLAALGLAVFALAGAAVWFSPSDNRVATWWPAAGLAVLAVAWAPRRRRPAVLVTVWVASTVANVVIGGRPPLTAVGLGLANTLEAAVVVWWLLRGRARPSLQTLDDVGRLLVGTLLGVVVMGAVGGTAVALTGYGDLLVTARTVMASHAAAILLVVPLGMLTLRPRSPSSTATGADATAQWLALAGAMLLVFADGQTLPLTFLPLPLVVWGALRQRPTVVAVQLVLVGVLVTTATSLGGGPFAQTVGHGSTLAAVLVQAYLVTLVLVALPLSVSVSMRRVTLEGLAASERLFRLGFSDSLLGMLLVRRDDGGGPDARDELRVVELNPVAARLLGGDEEELLGTRWTERLADDDRALVAEVVADMAQGRLAGWRGEVALRTVHGLRWLELALSPLPDSVGTGMFVGQLVDVTARKEAEDRLTAQALQDALTGLANRNLLRDRIGLALETLPEDGGGVAVLFCDLDDFKLVNDTAGHPVGDDVLVEVARRVEALVRPGDLAARLGGDEFVVLRPHAGSPAEAEELASRVIAALEDPVQVGAATFTVGVSVGIVWGGRGDTPDDLLRDADAAMYAAKAEGKRRAVLYSDEHRTRALRTVRLEGELRRALDATAAGSGELDVHLQPVVDLRTAAVVAAEALVRWHHPERGLLVPGEWLDVAEDAGLMPRLGELVLERACTLAAAWGCPDGGDAPAVHVNVSARQLDQPDFLDVVRRVLHATGLAPERLVLEFTETHLDEVSDALLADLAVLRGAGIGLAADDYGTGYSPLTRVIELPISMIKIDRRFVSSMTEDLRSRAIVTTLVRLGQTLGLEVVAEGVETAAQASELRALGCAAGQGYLWSRPVPDAQFRADLAASPAPSGLAPAPVTDTGARARR